MPEGLQEKKIDGCHEDRYIWKNYSIDSVFSHFDIGSISCSLHLNWHVSCQPDSSSLALQMSVDVQAIDPFSLALPVLTIVCTALNQIVSWEGGVGDQNRTSLPLALTAALSLILISS